MQHTQKMRNAYKTFAAETEVKRPLRELARGKNYTEIDLKYTWWEGMDWINLTTAGTSDRIS
jgi:hypothetical protein